MFSNRQRFSPMSKEENPTDPPVFLAQQIWSRCHEMNRDKVEPHSGRGYSTGIQPACQ